ncbi:hypothetical protein F7P69_00795 [Cellulosimicrobium funkei]|nr:hypothetical protein [Cellulosimicrobium funkei]
MAGKTAILSVRIVGDGKPFKKSMDGAARSVARFNQQAGRATQVVKLTNALKQMSGVRILSDATQNVGQFLGNLDRTIPRLATMSTGVLTLGSAALAGTSNVLALGASLSSVAGAALALPGILAGFAIGITAMILALKDAPKVLGDLAPAFGELQNAVSTQFWASAEGPIRNLVQKVLPTLQSGLTSVAGELGSFFASMAGALSTDLSIGQMGQIFEYTRESIDRASEGIASFMDALMILGVAGSSYLPSLATWFNTISERFAAFLNESAGDGRLHAWIQGGITALQELGRVVGEAGGILAGLSAAAAAAGGAGLTQLADGLARVNEAVNGPIWQGALTTVFSGAHAAMSALAPGVAALAGAFVALAPTLATVMELAGQIASVALTAISEAFQNQAFQGGLVSFFEGVLVGVQGLAPALPAIAEAIGSVATFAGTLASVLGPVLGQAFIALSPVISSVLEVLTMLAPVIASMAQFVVQNSDAFVALGVAVLTGMAAFKGIQAAVMAYRGVMLGVTAVQMAVTTGMAAFRAGLTLKTAALVAASAAQRVLNTAMKANPIAIIITLVLALVAGIVYFITQTKTGQKIWKAFTSFVGSAIKAAGQIVNSIVKNIGNWWKSLVSSIQSLWNTAWRFVASLIASVVSQVQSRIRLIQTVVNVVIAAVRAYFTNGFNAVRSIVQSVISGVTSTIQRITGIVSSVTSTVRNAFTSAFSAVRSTVMSVINGVVGGFNRIIGVVRNAIGFVRDLFSGIKPPGWLTDVLGMGGTGFEFAGGPFPLMPAGLGIGATGGISLAPLFDRGGNAPRRTYSDEERREAGVSLTQNIYPTEGMSEEQVGRSASTQIMFKLGAR